MGVSPALTSWGLSEHIPPLLGHLCEPFILLPARILAQVLWALPLHLRFPHPRKGWL